MVASAGVTDALTPLARRVAGVTLFLAPVLVFRPIPVPGVAYAAMGLPLIVLVIAYVSTAGNRLPVAEAALIGLLALSLLWSDETVYSYERLRSFLPVVAATVVAGCLLPGEAVLRCLKASIGFILVTSLVSILLQPGSALRAGSPDVVLTAQFAKNVYGGLLVVGLLLLLDRKRRLNLLLLPGLLVLLALNRTVTAWCVGLLLVVATLAFRTVLRRLAPSTASAALIGLVAAGAGALLLASSVDLDAALSAVGKDPSLGRRTEIWEACWIGIQQAPLLGHGAYAFLDPSSNSPVTQLVLARFQGYTPPHPHNGALDLVGQVGLVGLAAFLVLVLGAIATGLRSAVNGSSSARTAVLGLVFVLTFGVTEPSYLGPWLVLTVMFVAIADPRRGPAPSVVSPSLDTTAQPKGTRHVEV